MATKAKIVRINKVGQAKWIETLSEGYPEYTGELLLKTFKSHKKVEQLLDLGTIDYLLPELDAVRMMDEPTMRVMVGKNWSDLWKNTQAEFIYIFSEKDKTWYTFTDEWQVVALKDYMN